MSATFEEGGLGNLAQSARTNQLKSARGILLGVGILTVLVNLGLVIFADRIVDAEIEKELKPVRAAGNVIDQEALKELREGAIRSLRFVDGIAVLLGVVFIVCGILVYTYPVPVTIVSLVLYLGSAAVFGVIDPSTLAKGWIVKIVIVIALFKAVQAALAFESERKRATTVAPLFPT
ncbi:MAG: hypothetical protein IT425_11230 [Pirellulales bacterium]|nr:hypothetical protein [Pirellulales bacterium]